MSNPYDDGDRNTKKVRFKDVEGTEETCMVVDSEQQPMMSFKEKLLGGGVASPDRNLARNLGRDDGGLEILDGDMNTSMVNGISAIAFSERIKDILFKEMESTIVLKLLGQNIGYNFQDMEDYNKVLTQGSWIFFGQYLTVQPWTRSFNPTQPYPSVVLAWIRLLGLPGYLYKRQIIEAIGGLIGKVVKLDFQTDKSTRGRFARLAVFVNLDQPLIFKDLVDGDIQRVEYESLPTVCFNCGRYGHVKELCSAAGVGAVLERSETFLEGMKASPEMASGVTVGGSEDGKNNDFGRWMLVEKKSQRRSRNSRVKGDDILGKDPLGSRFTPLVEGNNLGGGLNAFVGGFVSGKGKSQVILEGVSGLDNARADLSRGKIGSKSMGKRPMGSGDFLQKEKDQCCNFTNSISLVPSTGSGNLKMKKVQAGRLSNGSSGGPSGDQEMGKEHSGLSEFRKGNLVLNNPTQGRRLKKAGISRIPLSDTISSMVNLVNSQGAPRPDGIGGTTTGQTGCANLKFPSIFWEYNREHKSDLVGLLETRVSGPKADSIISKLGFECSHRVEAVGFSGGIWIGWKDYITGSPNGQKRKQLWEAPKHTMLVDGSPWLAIGDFNAIIALCEKRGGRVIGKICGLFSEFMDFMGLQDLGFNGPNFTWNRGGVFERLDRAICNEAWSLKFPSSKVIISKSLNQTTDL
ncbi:uncharacterized protein LOC108464989 [Gossypium arboreum]|uniref:uncharacterized protein LOC108464989 n=1 Tax=Gossypium arboreum TaxID=29729 RepID=UPI0008196F7E|nr:uncharacterized protein LOC108464989 [Gossypium arboreum]